MLLLGTPMIWWGGVVALLYAVAMWLGARDWRFGVAVVGTASTWLPWLAYDDRPIFLFYAIAILPFLVIALTLGIGKLVGTARTTLGPTYGGRGRGRLVRGAGAAQLRVVLADLDPRAAHPVGVAGPDLVPTLDLTAVALDPTAVATATTSTTAWTGGPMTSWRPGWGGFAPGLLDFWTERHLCTLTTLRPDGRPHVVPVGVALDPERECAWVITRAGSRKVRNLDEADPPGTGLVVACQVDGGRWSSLEGVATVHRDAGSVARACERYAARYRTPSENPTRVALRIEVDRFLGSAGLFG